MLLSLSKRQRERILNLLFHSHGFALFGKTTSCSFTLLNKSSAPPLKRKKRIKKTIIPQKERIIRNRFLKMAWPKDTWSAQIFSSHSPPFFLISLLRLRNLSTPLSEKCRGKMYETVRDLVPHCSTRSTHVVRASLVCEHFIVDPSEGQNARRERKWKTLGTRLCESYYYNCVTFLAGLWQRGPPKLQFFIFIYPKTKFDVPTMNSNSGICIYLKVAKGKWKKIPYENIYNDVK